MKKYFWFWNIDYKRHNLIVMLSKNRTSKELRINLLEKTGFSFENVCKKLKCNRKELHEITSELYENQEILYTNIELKGLYGTRKAIEADTNNKYKKRYYDLWLNVGRNISQILIPILALTITILVIVEDNQSTNIKIQELRLEVLNILKQKEMLENPSKKNHPIKKETDTLNKK
ncbi:hypothetical protein ES044_17930 [Polaribacter sp. IC066]|uniref:hypothetical protein n=1 Tax=Polaribacter sp. IC066 TaxID=57032 RepID=UPI0011BECC0C|nr:hypothetical protein [Polaribacter sp. IC066]TXD55576.1 hypothetical protein ES044_17930 [Polaribacter sp. IC066]